LLRYQKETKIEASFRLRFDIVAIITRVASSSYELSALSPFPACCNSCQGFYAAAAKIMFYIAIIFALVKLLNKLIFKKRSFLKITKLVNIFALSAFL
jgi:hypothetical protein